jgi:Asp-tRNA(Asn)/Glu-tRNA(Gln) amidotransferase A subunit family amidase
MKPSYGLISRAGVLQLSRKLDHIGLFARSLSDLALILEVIAGHDPADPDSEPFAAADFRALQSEPPPLPPRFAFVRTPMWEKADSETKAAFEELVAALGPAVESVDLPASFREAWDAHRTIMSVDMAHNLDRFFAHGEPSEAMRKLLAHARKVSAVDYLAALDQAQRITSGLGRIFDAYDAIITPSAPGVAPKGLGSTGDPVFCTLWTLSGLPSLSLPLLAGSGGLPLGVQLVGPPKRDGRLLRTATALIEMLRAAEKGKRRSAARSRK